MMTYVDKPYTYIQIAEYQQSQQIPVFLFMFVIMLFSIQQKPFRDIKVFYYLNWNIS